MRISASAYTIAAMFFTQGVSSFSFGSKNHHRERLASSARKQSVTVAKAKQIDKRHNISTLLNGLTSGAIAITPLVAMADDVEIAELPPPYVPVAVAVVLLGGVGVLTSSLGDVLADGKFIQQSIERDSVNILFVLQTVFVEQNFKMQH